MNRNDILEHTGAERWEWIEKMFSGLTVKDIERRMHELFGWEDAQGLAVAIHAELGPDAILSEEAARWLGYRVVEGLGGRMGGPHDRKGLWYIEVTRITMYLHVVGYPSKRAALRHLTRDYRRRRA